MLYPWQSARHTTTSSTAISEQSPRRKHYCGRSAQARKGCRVPWRLEGGGGLRRLDQPNFSFCCSLSGGLLACLAQAAGALYPWTNYSSDEWIYCPGFCRWHDRCPSAVTGPPDGIAGCSRFCGCHVCLVCGLWMARPRARWRGCCVGLASQVEPNPQRLLRFLSHSPLLPTFFHFAVCVAPVQIAFASTSPFPPSPPPLNRLISGIPHTLNTIPPSDSLCASVCKR